MRALQATQGLRHARRGGAPDPAAIYRDIRESPTPLALAHPFTAHVFACAATVGICEAADIAENVSNAIGLDRHELTRLIQNWLPGAQRHIDLDLQPDRVALDDEEAQLRELLARHRVDQTEATGWIASIVTRRSMAPRHLWQDLGLLDRGELTRLLKERFPALAARNVANMKWKKFFYRSLCELEGFTLCAAPTCRECGEFADCFGEETGESALARLARNQPAS